MKNLKLLLWFPAVIVAQTLFAQTGAHLKLTSQQPAAGEKVNFTYDPTGTVIEGQKNIEATVFYLDNKDDPAMDIDLKPDGNFLKGELDIPPTAKAFFIKIEAGGKIDANNGKGYIYPVYKDGQPCEGAYATVGYVISSGLGNHFAQIKTDVDVGIELFKKEFALHPAGKRQYESNYYGLVGKKPEYKQEILNEIVQLEKSNDEKDLMTALKLYYDLGQGHQAEALANKITDKFPTGTIARQNAVTKLYMEKDLKKNDSLYNVYITKFPENAAEPSTSHDEATAIVAGAHLKTGDMAGYYKYEAMVKNKMEVAGYLNNVAWDWAVAGKHMADAEKISKQAVDIITKCLENPPASAYTSAKQARKNYENSYNMFADTYAYILWKENKSTEALPYMKTVYDRTSDEENSIEHYAEILGGAGQYAKAMEVIEHGYSLGQYSDVYKTELKKDYIALKGNDKGFDAYVAPMENKARAKILSDLAKTMINEPAPAFALKDFDGKTVSLADLKGKVVIIDFWATWCGPCKASFPGMQMAVNKYKNDPNVKFLFIDTWENGKDYEPGVKKFIADNKYTFHVLMDEQNDEGRQAKIVSAYKVNGIPTKFLIDKTGNIRFKYVGYSGSPEKVLDEVTNMITLTGNPELAKVEPAKSNRGK
ncbi:TlpA disulfide reductase family protein [Mucilaginibacter sp.]|jgi:peroxiredoxin|uniref:TlpA disulfide reductase family protein n=1 Tax=Mucilaginibacter sp. TaxID=1882438 RepID=UPI002C1BCBFE|nr:TlpA disulfide reductase family protein [Mucilaginibacter sp.]HTI57415.1 TlpA disulfide reductase family protein [Mucilaginibacter sp.]